MEDPKVALRALNLACERPTSAELKLRDASLKRCASYLKKQRRGKFGSAAQGTGHTGEKDALKLDARLRKEMELKNPQEKKVKGVLVYPHFA